MILLYLMMGLLLGIIVARIALQRLLVPRKVKVDVISPEKSRSEMLVVLVHGMAGRKRFHSAVKLIQSWLPEATFAVADYDSRVVANTDPSVVADELERSIHRLVKQQDFQSVILVGHSSGGAVLRKAFVWAHGQEVDRTPYGKQGKRDWVDRVERIVLLAGINRGYSISPRPRKMTLGTYLAIWIGLRLSRILGISKLARSFQRGEPFIADTRVQWLRIARDDTVLEKRTRFPVVIQLVGSEDDIVAREDSLDLVVSKGTLFKTVPQTNHRDIGTSLGDASRPGFEERVRYIKYAVLGDVASLEPDEPPDIDELRDVKHIVYVMHGIRDYGHWTDIIRSAIEARYDAQGAVVRVVNQRYGYFPMLQFMTYGDRQRNVRVFMDEYTENLSRFPNAQTIDFIGHSNGTYLLASALTHYTTPRVRRVFFAGSVVPKHYPWQELIVARRVESVVNVVATADWVVAVFPKIFEQIADWTGRQPRTGWLDLGAAGFRGFLAAGSATGAVVNLTFAEGTHSTGVDVKVPEKLQAIVAWIVNGDREELGPFRSAQSQSPLWNVLSNISYLVWALLIGLVAALGWWIEATLGLVGLSAYLVVLFMLLSSI